MLSAFSLLVYDLYLQNKSQKSIQILGLHIKWFLHYQHGKNWSSCYIEINYFYINNEHKNGVKSEKDIFIF